MALTAEQTKEYQDQYKKLRLEGMDAQAASDKIRESIKAGISRPQLGPDGRPLDPNGYKHTLAATTVSTPVVPNATVPAANPTVTPRGVAGGAYEANLTAKPAATPASPVTPAPVNFAEQAAKIQANPKFQSAYADQTVAGRTNADRVLAGLTPQQIESEKAKDAAWNAKQAEFDRLNPVGTKIDAPTAQDAQQSGMRQQEILNNLQEGQKNSPQLFQDQATFRNAYGYDQKPPEEKAQLDAFWAAQNKRTADQLIDMALARQDLTPYKGTPEYLTAQRVGKAVLDYSKMTPPLLAERMGAMESDLLPGSKAYAVLTKANPQLVAEAERIRDANRRSGIIGYDDAGKPKTNRLPDAVESVGNSIINENPDTPIPTLAAALDTSDIKAARTKASGTKTELNTLYDTIESVEDDVRAELKGTGATESYIRALISERTKPLMKQVNSLERRYANEAGDLKALTDVATDSFKYSWELASEDRKMEREKALIKFKQSLESDGTKTDLVDMGDKKALINKSTGKVIAEYDINKPLTDSFEFRSETDQYGNQVTAVFDKKTGKKISGGAGESASGGSSNYGDAVSYLASAGYETSPAIIKSVAGKSFDEVKAMYPTREGITSTGKPQTEGQSLASGFSKRINESNAGINGLETYVKTLNPAEFATYSIAPNFLKPDKFQQYEQYQREFITAQLRKESGAAISETEWKNAREQYFPQPGDSNAVIDQKRKSRELAYQNMVTASGIKGSNQVNAQPGTTAKQNFRVVGSTQDNTKQLAQLRASNPIDAGPKYNNMGGITFRGANGKEMPFNETLRKAGIPFEEGGVRGKGGEEGGTYVKFKTVGDGIDAYNLLWKTNGFQSLTVQDALKRWGTDTVNLPKEVLSGKVSSTDKATISKLKALQISKESPAMFQYLKDNGLLKNL